MILVSACGTHMSRSDDVTPTLRSDVTTASGLPSSFGFQRFTSFEDAERAAGYHIPRTTRYELLRNTVYLQSIPNGRSNALKASAIFRVPPDKAIYLDVVPGLAIPADASFQELGGRMVTPLDGDPANLVFGCGYTQDMPVSCTVLFPDVGREALADFLSSLQ